MSCMLRVRASSLTCFLSSSSPKTNDVALHQPPPSSSNASYLPSATLLITMAGVHKGELVRPDRHILVRRDGSPVLIDFERCKLSSTPQNVLQVCQFLASKALATALGANGKGVVLDCSGLRDCCRAYKHNKYQDGDFARILALVERAGSAGKEERGVEGRDERGGRGWVSEDVMKQAGPDGSAQCVGKEREELWRQRERGKGRPGTGGGWGIVGGSGSWADGLGVEGDELETFDMEGGEMEGVGNCRPMAVGRQKAMDKALQG
jgi:hypothetical protein